MEVLAQYLGDSKFEVTASGYRVICDQPLARLASFHVKVTAQVWSKAGPATIRSGTWPWNGKPKLNSRAADCRRTRSV